MTAESGETRVCEHCGYDMSGVKDAVCPECGKPPHLAHEERMARALRPGNVLFGACHTITGVLALAGWLTATGPDQGPLSILPSILFAAMLLIGAFLHLAWSVERRKSAPQQLNWSDRFILPLLWGALVLMGCGCLAPMLR
jgi:hypothetical protein